MRYYCHTFYQAKGAYAHLYQKSDKDLEDTVADATANILYDDPLNLAILCILLLECLPEPPDGAHKSIILLTLIIFVYLYPVVRGLILH